LTCPKEDHEQRDVVKFLRKEKIHFFSVPNSQQLSGLNRKVASFVMGTLKALGLSPGVPDMVIFMPEKILFIEMKRLEGGTVSKFQRHWLTVINSFEYAEAFVCRGHKQAIELIKGKI
jgi:hypothetical protein